MPNDTILKGPVPLTPIPEGANPYRAIVNGVEHDYEAGSSAAVAPGVKELINAADNFPPTAEEVKPPFAGGGGGGGGVLVVRAANDTEAGSPVLDKTWQEIHDAPFAVIKAEPRQSVTALVTDILYITVLEEPLSAGSAKYVVRAQVGQTEVVFETSSADGYPVFVNEGNA